MGSSEQCDNSTMDDERSEYIIASAFLPTQSLEGLTMNCLWSVVFFFFNWDNCKSHSSVFNSVQSCKKAK